MSLLYPVYLDLDRRPVLLIGAGRVAARRIPRLLESGACVRVVSPDALPEIEAWAREGRLEWVRRRFTPADLDGAALALLAVGDPRLLDEVRAEAARRGVLLNTAESAETCDFHVPAVARRGPVQAAVSTGGASPALARDLARRIQRELPAGGAAAAARAGRVTTRTGTASPRRSIEEGPRGRVFLVGAGPGDPALLTARAVELLEEADVVFHDRLVSDAVLARIPPRVEKVYVGKVVGCAHRANIGALLVEAARRGRRVVRLKGGDPGLYGRVGEEMLELRRAGVDFEVVPGVSALCSVPGAAGIPVTYRHLASQLVVRSGHRMRGAAESRRPPSETTFVYFMASGQIERVVAELREEGVPAATPVAVIQEGTLPGEKVLVARLDEIARELEEDPVEPPALVIVGEVVRFRDIDALLAMPGIRGTRSETAFAGAEPASEGGGQPRAEGQGY